LTPLSKSQTLVDYIKKEAPKEYHNELIPDFRMQTSHFACRKLYEELMLVSCIAPGCKRVIVDRDYLKSLHRPNVNLNWTPIETVVEEGLKLKTGEVIPLDIIIFATGFSLVR
jgi:cation diffusion facilitator CzcD-associated flavoprotein CzcO